MRRHHYIPMGYDGLTSPLEDEFGDVAWCEAIDQTQLTVGYGSEDVEANGDEQDTCNAEDDEFAGIPPGFYGDGMPGCPISDPGGGNVTDEPHDARDEDGF